MENLIGDPWTTTCSDTLKGKRQGWEVNKEFKLIANILLQSPNSNDLDVNKISHSFENKPLP